MSADLSPPLCAPEPVPDFPRLHDPATTESASVDPSTLSVQPPTAILAHFAKYHDVLVAMLRRIPCFRAVAENAAQDALIRVWKKIRSGTFSKIKRLRAWLRRVAINKAKNLLKRDSRPEIPLAPTHEPFFVPVDDLARTEDYEKLHALFLLAVDALEGGSVSCSRSVPCKESHGKLPPGT